MSGKVIAVANQKGGVTKTVTCRNLADIYASQGKKVLLIDLDPQSSLTMGYNLDEKLFTGENDGNICNIFKNKDLTIVALDEIYNESIHIIPSNPDLNSVAESAIVGKDLKLKRFIKDNDLRAMYDVIIIDNNPTFGSLTINSILAAEIFVVPVGTTEDDQKGLHKFFDKTEAVLEAYGHTIEKIVCIPSRYNKVTKVANVYLEALRNDVKPYIDSKCPTLSHANYITTQPIPESVAFQEASGYSLSAYSYLSEYGTRYCSLSKEKRDELLSTLKKIAKKTIK